MDPRLVKHLEEIAEKDKSENNTLDVPRELPKCPNVVSALHKAMQISLQNQQVIGKRIMITVDMSEKMEGPCLNCKNLSCLDAASILILSFLKAEKDVTVAVFNGITISLVLLDKSK